MEDSVGLKNALGEVARTTSPSAKPGGRFQAEIFPVADFLTK